MNEGFGQEVKSEVIVINGLNNYNVKNSYGYFDDRKMKWDKKDANPNKPENEIEKEIKEEIKINKDKLKEESMQRDYKIDKEKTKELEIIFKQIKLKINFDSKAKILRDGKFYTISQGNLFIYDNRFFYKLHEIKLEDYYNYTSVIQLDNQDLILFARGILMVYRLINGKFIFVQKINDNKAGYPMQNEYSGCYGYPKPYSAKFIKEISGNRFILVSNYGYKIYSLNEKNEYTISLLEVYHKGIKTIIELDKDNFIFLSQKECDTSLGGPEYNVFFIDKISLREISQSEKTEKLKELKDIDYYDNIYSYSFYNFKKNKPPIKLSKEEIKNTIESLKYTHMQQKLLNSSYDYHHYFRGNAILKNKYFIVAIDNNISIFDINSGKQIKKYEILLYGEDNLYKCGGNINKWNNNKDNEFIINLGGNIIMFELTDKNELKITNQIYFKNIENLKRFNEKVNKFYGYSTKEDLYDNSFFYREDKNIINSVTIF